MTIVKEIVKEKDSPVRQQNTRVEEIREKVKNQGSVSRDQSPHTEGQSGSKVDILQR